MTQPIRLILSGGLGNQLFQLAAGTYIESNLERTVLYDVSNLIGNLKSEPGNYTRNLEISELIDPNKIVSSRLPLRAQIYKYTIERTLFSNSLLVENGPTDHLIPKITEQTKKISGFFQHASLVEKSWTSLQEKLIQSNKFSKFFNSQKINRIAIHLRFGDYSDDPRTKSTYGLTKLEYYLESYREITEQNLPKFEIAVVSDNLEMAKKTINHENTQTEVTYISNSSAIDDLFEIARSSHVVMSNSTFSWWGAWFAYQNHEAKVIYPRPWFADNSDPDLPIYFDRWIAKKREFFV